MMRAPVFSSPSKASSLIALTAVHGRTLTISGERREEKERNHEGYLARERSYGAFSRSFLLPEDIDEDDITATFEDGQLKVSVPRPKVETPRTIEITTSS
jgi:HSP20 family protein